MKTFNFIIVAFLSFFTTISIGAVIQKRATSRSRAQLQIIAFLNQNIDNMNDGNIVPLDTPQMQPKVRTRTSEEGCAKIMNGFICVDLSRNVRCVDGKIAENKFKPFSGDSFLKACVGGFCGGGLNAAGGNNCVGTAEQALDGSLKGNEFFIRPKVGGVSNRPVKTLSKATTIVKTATTASGNGSFKKSNGIKAQQLDSQKANNNITDPCTEGAVLCVGDKFAQCANKKLVETSCAGGLKCQVLPLVNSPGVSVTCSTDADKNARIAAALAS